MLTQLENNYGFPKNDMGMGNFKVSSPHKKTFWFLLLKSTIVFCIVSLVVFTIMNYQFIKLQFSELTEEKDYSIYIEDQDLDGLPDWWEKKYGLDKDNPEDSKEDTDGDGLSNILEYQFNTDPNNPDTDGDGFNDGEEVSNGYNPNGIGRLDTDGDGLYDWWEKRYGLDKDNPEDSKEDTDGDGLNNKNEFIYKTDPRNPDSDGDGITDGDEVSQGTNPAGEGRLESSYAEIDLEDEDQDGLELDYEIFFGTDPRNKDTDGDGYDDYHELTRGYDPTGTGLIEGQIEIPSIGVKAPVIWLHNFIEEDVEENLELGLVHYPGSAFPSLRGNCYITGHSSYYDWEETDYKEILKEIDKIKVGDKVIFHLTFSDERVLEVIYEVAVKGEVVLPDDERIFRDYEGHELTLVTCWPLGTNWKRMMVKADLVKPSF